MSFSGTKRRHKRKKKIVLDDDEYLARLGAILRRDYFPDLQKLQAESDYLSALEKSDLDALRTAIGKDRCEDATDCGTLEEFHRKYTSEDNASFDEILDRMNANKRERWERVHGSTPLLNAPPDRRLLLAPSRPTEAFIEAAGRRQLDPGSTRFKVPIAPRRDESAINTPLTVSSDSVAKSLFYIPATPQREQTAQQLLSEVTGRTTERASEADRTARARAQAAVRNSPFGGVLSSARRTPSRSQPQTPQRPNT